MNTTVNFEIAKLLKEKGYSWECINFYKKDKSTKNFYLTTGTEYDSDRDCIWDWNLNGGKSGMLLKAIPYPNDDTAIYYSAPTIAEVLMWFHEKHAIWISVHLEECRGYEGYDFNFIFVHDHEKTINALTTSLISSESNFGECVFNSPTEAYEAAIKHTLENII